MVWQGINVLVTGGASFIGSHLVEALLARGAQVTVVDDLSSGRLEYIDPRASFLETDLRCLESAFKAVSGRQVVFHLAAHHGGRGFIDERDPECSRNLVLDGNVFFACHELGVDKLIYASSACVYPTPLQRDPIENIYLNESMVGPPFQADNLYGWAKLIGEMTLAAYYKKYGMRSVACRYFTVYGPRCGESHAIMAMIGRALRRENPFIVWGNGEQVRNWTHVDDIVSGTLLAAERISDARAINLGTMERIRVIDVAREILGYFGHDPVIKLLPHQPTGPFNRVADNSLAAKLLGWRPCVAFSNGLQETIEWRKACRLFNSC